MPTKELQANDPRIDFMDILQSNFEKRVSSNEDDAETNLLHAMVDTVITVRKELDEEVRSNLKDLNNLREFTKFLLIDYKPITFFDDRDEIPRFFSEYLLYSLLDKEEAKNIIDFDYLRSNFSKSFNLISDETKENLLSSKELFEWNEFI
jgi:hypothetical protein